MMREERLLVHFDLATAEATSTSLIVREGRQLAPLVLPPGVIDLTDDPDLFETVRANPRRYRVENGRVVPKTEAEQ